MLKSSLRFGISSGELLIDAVSHMRRGLTLFEEIFDSSLAAASLANGEILTFCEANAPKFS
jgi:hypothetical protein